MMNLKNKGFTLIEMTISMFIISIIIVGITLSLNKIGENLSDSSVKNDIFSQIKEFNYDSYLFKYNSGKLLTGALLLYNDKNGVIIGSFLDQSGGYDYKVNTDIYNYSQNYFGYFKINDTTLSGILNDSLTIDTLKFNDGKIFKNIILKDFEINLYNTGNLYEIDMNVFKKYSTKYDGLKSDIFVKSDDYLKFNFNF